MSPYFSTPERVAALRATFQQWEGTPFHRHASVCQAGVDCVHLAAELYKGAGFLETFEPGPYNMDGGSHELRSKVIDWLERSGKFCRAVERRRSGLTPKPNCCGGVAEIAATFDRKLLLPGDLLCFKISRVPWHVGVVLDADHFANVFEKHRATKTPFADRTWQLGFVAAYRPIQL